MAHLKGAASGSVARSPLKNPEDFLGGQSIVFSAEALLRQRSDIVHGRTACVIGYGKLGRSIANLLHARHVRIVVYDIETVKRIEAMSHGFAITNSVETALSRTHRRTATWRRAQQSAAQCPH